MVGQTALVCFFPLLAQLTQAVLHFPTTNSGFQDKLFLFTLGNHRYFFEQGFGLEYQCQTALVCHMPLPSGGIASSQQGFMHLQVHGGVHVAAMLFKGLTQCF